MPDDNLRQRYAEAINRVLEKPNGWAYRGTLPGVVMAVRDKYLAEAVQRAEVAEKRAQIAVRELHEERLSHGETVAGKAKAEAALARFHADCEHVASRPITDDLSRGIWAQARRTLNILRRSEEHTHGR